jgi:acyl-CoA reductase-like NAD-dependent aldehyde dehydrogenase
MSEREFESYLQLLARMLHLSPEQRDAIAAELRDHLDSRLSELTDAGVERDQAVHQALAEFGDASAFAHDLLEPARHRCRRRLVHPTVGTLAAAAAIALGFMYLLPSDRIGAPQPP